MGARPAAGLGAGNGGWRSGWGWRRPSGCPCSSWADVVPRPGPRLRPGGDLAAALAESARRSSCRTCSACRTAAGSRSGSSGRATCTSGFCRSGWRSSGRCSPRRRIVPFFLLLARPGAAGRAGRAEPDQHPPAALVAAGLLVVAGAGPLRLPDRVRRGRRWRRSGWIGWSRLRAALVADGRWRRCWPASAAAALIYLIVGLQRAPAGRPGPLADADRRVLPRGAATSTTGSRATGLRGSWSDGLDLRQPEDAAQRGAAGRLAAAAAGLGALAAPGAGLGGAGDRAGGRRSAGVRLRLPPPRADRDSCWSRRR